jgi:hypothetical protein
VRRNAIVEEALASCPKNPDGSVDWRVLREHVKKLIKIDAESALNEKADRLIKRNTKPGGTQAKGQLTLPGIEPYPYEPNRLIKGPAKDDGEEPVIIQDEAPQKFKVSQFDREMDNMRKVLKRISYTSAEVKGFNDYLESERKSGNNEWASITFGDYLRKTGRISDLFDGR